MKPELWLNRADHEIALAKELLEAGSLLWAVSYAHRSVEYALEGLIVLKTGERPERGLMLADLQAIAAPYLPDSMIPAINDLVSITPVVWKADIKADQIAFLTDRRTRKLIDEAKETLSWIGEEWERSVGSGNNPENLTSVS